MHPALAFQKQRSWRSSPVVRAISAHMGQFSADNLCTQDGVLTVKLEGGRTFVTWPVSSEGVDGFVCQPVAGTV